MHGAGGAPEAQVKPAGHSCVRSQAPASSKQSNLVLGRTAPALQK